MRWALTIVLVLHGLIHLMGFAKAFGFAQLEALKLPISRPMGVLWLVAALLVLASAALAWSRWFWLVGAVALVASQWVIVSSWSDAKFGTAANVILLVAVVYGFASQGPLSFRAEYEREARALLAAAPGSLPLVTDADLAGLPEPVARYLRYSGTVGQPRVANFRATWKGRIRGSPAEPWMSMSVDQVSTTTGAEPARLFLIDATMKGVPADVFHRFVGDAATFRVKVASLFTVVDAKGPEMNRAETVTIFNDLCLVAPAALIDPAIRWEPIDARAARATFTRGAETISAELRFDETGALVDFISDDRLAASPDGTQFTRKRWSTPVLAYGQFGAHRLLSRGEAKWHDGATSFTYAELELTGIEFNVRP
ncbi:MAG: hypothetical protein JNJ54_34795 [Myxococcaceae bacterium]|nr:hypothetical protein [Myxococcaceae bacterium]